MGKHVRYVFEDRVYIGPLTREEITRFFPRILNTLVARARKSLDVHLAESILSIASIFNGDWNKYHVGLRIEEKPVSQATRILLGILKPLGILEETGFRSIRLKPSLLSIIKAERSVDAGTRDLGVALGLIDEEIEGVSEVRDHIDLGIIELEYSLVNPSIGPKLYTKILLKPGFTGFKGDIEKHRRVIEWLRRKGWRRGFRVSTPFLEKNVNEYALVNNAAEITGRMLENIDVRGLRIERYRRLHESLKPLYNIVYDLLVWEAPLLTGKWMDRVNLDDYMDWMWTILRANGLREIINKSYVILHHTMESLDILGNMIREGRLDIGRIDELLIYLNEVMLNTCIIEVVAEQMKLTPLGYTYAEVEKLRDGLARKIRPILALIPGLINSTGPEELLEYLDSKSFLYDYVAIPVMERMIMEYGVFKRAGTAKLAGLILKLVNYTYSLQCLPQKHLCNQPTNVWCPTVYNAFHRSGRWRDTIVEPINYSWRNTGDS